QWAPIYAIGNSGYVYHLWIIEQDSVTTSAEVPWWPPPGGEMKRLIGDWFHPRTWMPSAQGASPSYEKSASCSKPCEAGNLTLVSLGKCGYATTPLGFCFVVHWNPRRPGRVLFHPR